MTTRTRRSRKATAKKTKQVKEEEPEPKVLRDKSNEQISEKEEIKPAKSTRRRKKPVQIMEETPRTKRGRRGRRSKQVEEEIAENQVENTEENIEVAEDTNIETEAPEEVTELKEAENMEEEKISEPVEQEITENKEIVEEEKENSTDNIIEENNTPKENTVEPMQEEQTGVTEPVKEEAHIPEGQVNYGDILNIDDEKMEQLETDIAAQNLQNALPEDDCGETQLLGKRTMNNGENIVNRQLDQATYPNKKYSGKNTFKYEEYNEESPYQEINETIQEMMTNLGKNPIALLNEYCSRTKRQIEYKFKVKTNQKKQVYYCQISINHKPLHENFQSKNYNFRA